MNREQEKVKKSSQEEMEILKQKGLWPLPEAFRPIDEKKPTEHSVFEFLEKISRGLTERQREIINAIKLPRIVTKRRN